MVNLIEKSNALFIKGQLLVDSFIDDEKGVTAVEYAIVACAISAIVLTVFNGTLQGALATAMAKIATNINTAATAVGP